MWHARYPRDAAAYARDTQEFIGKFVNHKEDDDREEGCEPQIGFLRTVELWENPYNEPYKGKFAYEQGRVIS